MRCLPGGEAELWRGAELPGHHLVVLDLRGDTVLLVERGDARLCGFGLRARVGPGDACLVPRCESLVLETSGRAPLHHQLLCLQDGLTDVTEPLLVKDVHLTRVLRALEHTDPPSLDEVMSRARQPIKALRARDDRGAWVRRTVRTIASEPAATSSLAELARAAGVSPYHLAHRFKEEVGVSPHMFRTCVRVACARLLLREGAALATVAAQCGFADQSHLHRWFTRLLGLTPGRYADAWRSVARAHVTVEGGGGRRSEPAPALAEPRAPEPPP